MNMTEKAVLFFNDLWSSVSTKHEQGIYNTVCLMVLLALPLVVLFTAVVICCHCCCCRAARDSADKTTTKTDKKKKKVFRDDEDLWISVKNEPMSPDRMGLTRV